MTIRCAFCRAEIRSREEAAGHICDPILLSLVPHEPAEDPVRVCLDCGFPTFCGVAHGAGHDHSPVSRACTARALGDPDPRTAA